MDLVATGGTAVLYRAVQTSLDRVVAVKKLHHHLTTDENFTRRFILEAKAAASLDHENIVKIIDFGVEDGTYMMVMEFIEGESLKDVLEKWKQIPPNLALAVAHQICMGLEHAHAKGIVHRDVKPGNIMLTRTGRVKITDFGLAKLSQSQTQHTAANSILGTPLYMSPEQAFGESVDQRSDLFSLGTVLYECLTGRQPFHGESYMGVIQNIIHQNAPSPSRLGVELPDAVGAILAKAMSKNRDARFQSARDFRLAIEKYLGLDALKEATDSVKSLVAIEGATMVLPRTERAIRRSHRLRKTLVTASTVAAVFGVAAIGYFLAPGTMRGWIADVIARSGKDEAPSTPTPSSKLFSAAILNGFGEGFASDSGVAYRASISDSLVSKDSTGTGAPDPAAPLPSTAVSHGANGETRALETPASDPEDPSTEAGDGLSDAQHHEVGDPARELARTGWLSVVSDPPAEMYIDDRYVGNAPTTRMELSSGRHSLECRSPKHEPYRETVNITAGELSSRTIVLVKLTGRVSLSTIEGAEVHVDGVLVGITPLEKPIELESGRHQLTIKKPGFHVWNNSVSIEAKQLLPITIALSPMY